MKKAIHDHRMEKNPRWRGGISKVIRHCEICSRQTSDYRYKRCGSCAMKGFKQSESWIKNRANKLKGLFIGENGPGWKGGISSIDRLIRNSSNYIAWRKFVFKRDDFTCRICNVRGGYLEVDHINQFKNILSEFLSYNSMFSPAEDKETLLRLALVYKPFWETENGRTLCKPCHKNITFPVVSK